MNLQINHGLLNIFFKSTSFANGRKFVLQDRLNDSPHIYAFAEPNQPAKSSFQTGNKYLCGDMNNIRKISDKGMWICNPWCYLFILFIEVSALGSKLDWIIFGRTTDPYSYMSASSMDPKATTKGCSRRNFPVDGAWYLVGHTGNSFDMNQRTSSTFFIKHVA